MLTPASGQFDFALRKMFLSADEFGSAKRLKCVKWKSGPSSSLDQDPHLRFSMLNV